MLWMLSYIFCGWVYASFYQRDRKLNTDILNSRILLVVVSLIWPLPLSEDIGFVLADLKHILKIVKDDLLC